MKKKLLYIAIFIATLNSYAQITFEKGYFIDNNDKKTECYIKNIDWKNNPTNFKYKINLNSETQTNTIEWVSEFVVTNKSKYIRKSVEIDRSTNIVNRMLTLRKPNFSTETLFLKVIIKGKANLFFYEDSNLRRFFYSINNKNVKQLIHKRYITADGIAHNNRFKQQLLNNLICENISIKKIEKLKYTNSSLSKYFTKYNQCQNTTTTTSFNKKTSKNNSFHLTIKAGINSSSLKITNITSNSRDTDFGTKNGIILSLEGEYTLPFNNNKWALAIEPTYQSFKAENKTASSSISGGFLISKANYKSLQVPVGVKHYFYLNKNSKIYISGSYIINLNLNSSIEFNRLDNSNLSVLDISTNSNFLFSLGYKYKKYSIETKYQTSTSALGRYLYWNQQFSSINLSIGYTFF